MEKTSSSGISLIGDDDHIKKRLETLLVILTDLSDALAKYVEFPWFDYLETTVSGFTGKIHYILKSFDL